MAEILEITQEDALKTKIMYKANLSFTQLNTYLQFMVINDLITHKTFEGREVYVITLKGFNFLQMHGALLQLLKVEMPQVQISPKTHSKPKARSRNVQAPSAVRQGS